MNGKETYRKELERERLNGTANKWKLDDSEQESVREIKAENAVFDSAKRKILTAMKDAGVTKLNCYQMSLHSEKVCDYPPNNV